MGSTGGVGERGVVDSGGLLHLAYPQDPPGALGYVLNYLGTAIFSGAYLGMLGGLVGLHARQAGIYGRMGTVGFYLAFVGAALALVGDHLTNRHQSTLRRCLVALRETGRFPVRGNDGRDYTLVVNQE